METKEIDQKRKKLEDKITILVSDFKKETGVKEVLIYSKEETYKSPTKEYVISSKCVIDCLI